MRNIQGENFSPSAVSHDQVYSENPARKGSAGAFQKQPVPNGMDPPARERPGEKQALHEFVFVQYLKIRCTHWTEVAKISGISSSFRLSFFR